MRRYTAKQISLPSIPTGTTINLAGTSCQDTLEKKSMLWANQKEFKSSAKWHRLPGIGLGFGRFGAYQVC